jgi:alpha-beta hydrolase superfamily lysophospholipase
MNAAPRRPALPGAARNWLLAGLLAGLRAGLRAGGLAVLLGLAACAPREIPMGAAVQAPALEDTQIVAADGTSLPLLHILPDGPPRAVVLALHGFNDYSNNFATAGVGWARAGIATYAYDQRGFGATPSPGIWPGSDTLIADAETAFALIRARYPGVPIFVAGESMGGSIILAAVGRGGFAEAAGFILLAPAVRGRDSFPAIAQPTFYAVTHTVPWLAGAPPDLGFRPTDNPTTLRLLATDPLIRRETRLDTVWGLVNLMDEAVAAGPHFTRPVLIAVGRRDNIVPENPIRHLVEHMPPEGPEMRRVAIYRGGFHLLTRDRQGPVVVADIAHWMLTRASDPASPLPSGADHEGW